MKEQCKERVYGPGQTFRGSPCARPVKSDGFCAIHHPDAVEKRREKSAAKCAAKTAKINARIDAESQMRKDAENYRWLRDNKAAFNGICWHFQNGPLLQDGGSLDEAIEKARGHL